MSGKFGITLSQTQFVKGLQVELKELEHLVATDLDHFTSDIVSRAKSLVPEGNVPGNPIAAAIKKHPGHDRKGAYVDVGVFRTGRETTEGEADPGVAAPAVEFGHIARDHKTHVAPRPFMRPAISQAIRALPKEVGR